MKPGISIIVYPVTDVAKAKKLFTQFLGVEPYVAPVIVVNPLQHRDLHIGCQYDRTRAVSSWYVALVVEMDENWLEASRYPTRTVSTSTRKRP